MSRKTMILAVSALVLASAPLTAGPDDLETPFIPGEVVEKVTCATDHEMTYALYLPSSYSAAERWPVLFVMDPRGRAPMALDLFRRAAEQYGYVLASSYNTLSDGPYKPNERAMRAVLPDVQQRLSIDPRRIYLAGFSGTARVAWDFGYRIRGVAGIIGIGGALPYGMSRLSESSFVFFGAAGATDFNYEEMRALDTKLDGTGITHRVEFFDGPHAWCPEALCAKGVEWLEIQAMRSNLKPADDAWLKTLAAERMDRAGDLEKEGKLHEAFVSYRAVAEDFAGLPVAGTASKKAALLESNKQVRRTVEKKKRLAAQQADFEGRLYQVIADFKKPNPPSLSRAVIQLRVKSLKKRAEGDDPLDALAARRLLELAFVNTSFYEPRDYLNNGDFERALGMLKIAGAIKPGTPRVCYGMARAQAQLGNRKEALDALQCVADSGLAQASVIESDSLLAPLRTEQRYQEIMERLSGE